MRNLTELRSRNDTITKPRGSERAPHASFKPRLLKHALQTPSAVTVSVRRRSLSFPPHRVMFSGFSWRRERAEDAEAQRSAAPRVQGPQHPCPAGTWVTREHAGVWGALVSSSQAEKRSLTVGHCWKASWRKQAVRWEHLRCMRPISTSGGRRVIYVEP